MSWLAALARHERTATASILVTVLAARGSVPREAGAKMVVTAADQDGSIGGGRLEHECAVFSRDLLHDVPAGPVTRDFPLGPALGQCCGGHVTVLFEPMQPAAAVALFGAGHVGQALVRLLGDLSFRVRWIDPRDAFPAEMPDNVAACRVADPETLVCELPAGAMALVMTHDHALDFRIVAACLRRGDLGFVGLIGSDTKRARFASRLRAQGISDAGLVCPIGLPGVGGKLPAEIALSVAAQLLQVRDSFTLSPRLGGRGRGEGGQRDGVRVRSPLTPILSPQAGGEGACAACRR